MFGAASQAGWPLRVLCNLEPRPATGSRLAAGKARFSALPGQAAGRWLWAGPPRPLGAAVLFGLELDCFALQRPLSARLEAAAGGLAELSFVFTAILQVQLPSSRQSVAAPRCLGPPGVTGPSWPVWRAPGV